jgi:hypothetical protein
LDLNNTWPDGGVYIGDWLNDKMHGYGKLVHPNGDTQTGDFINNHFLVRINREL